MLINIQYKVILADQILQVFKVPNFTFVPMFTAYQGFTMHVINYFIVKDLIKF